ncbi:MAG: hypothetical protein QXU18_15445 [Thermoplasmatales archaeon]
MSTNDDHDDDELDELKRSFIASDSLEKEDLKEALKVLREWGWVDNLGYVKITRKMKNLQQEVKFILCSRLVGNRLEQGIKSDVSVKELCDNTGRQKQVIINTLNDLKKEHSIIYENGLAKISDTSTIMRFVKELSEQTGEKNE